MELGLFNLTKDKIYFKSWINIMSQTKNELLKLKMGKISIRKSVSELIIEILEITDKIKELGNEKKF